MAKIAGILSQLRRKNAAWDEIAMITQWQIRGHINYCPLVGTPSPSELSGADKSLQALVFLSLRVRPSVEHKSCLASFSVGGLQLPSVVESMVAALAKDLSSTF